MTETRTIAVTAEIKVPEPPNFLRMTDGQTLSICHVDDDSLRRIGKAWTERLLEKKRTQNGGAESQ